MQTEYERRMRQIIRLMAQVKRYCLELGILLLLAGAVWFMAARIYRSVGVLLGRKRGRKRGRKAKKAKKGIAAILIGLLLGAAAGLYGFSPACAQTGEADGIADSGQAEAVSGLSEEEEARKEASPYIIKGFEIFAKGESSSYKGVLCTDGAVEAVLVFACHDPDPESVQVRMIPQDTRARRSVENSEFGEGDGGISLPGFQILQIEKDVYELRVQFFEEGKWKAVFYCEDRMGHALQGVRDGDSEDFIIDASSPLLEVSYEELIRITEKVCLPEKIGQDFSVDLAAIESSDGEAFFDPGRARTVICLKDDTFDPDRIRLEILRDDSGENISGEKGEQASPEDYAFVKKWEKISENTYRTILDFCEEGHYRIRISGTDAAGRSLIAEEAAETEACLKEGLYTSPLLTVDHSPPDISCQAVEGSMDVRPAVRIRVREDHFHPRFLQLEDQVLDADGKVIDSLSLKDYRLEWVEKRDKEERTYESVLTLEQEGCHEIKMYVKDGAGQDSPVRTLSMIYDISPPEIRYKGLDPVSDDIFFFVAGDGEREEPAIWVPYSSFASFHQKKIRVKITASDRVSGTARLVCHFKGSGRKSLGKGMIDPQEEVDKEIVITDEDREGGKILLTGYAEAPADNFKGTFSVYAEDYSGNRGKEIICRGMVSESEDLHGLSSAIRYILPEPDRKDTEKGIFYYRGDVKTGAEYFDDYSGIGLCRLSAVFGGHELVRKEKDMEAEKDLNYKADLSLILREDDYLDSNPEKPAILKAYFRDNAGNESDTSYEENRIVIDAAPPEIEVSYDLKEALQGKYYAKDRTAVVKVRESNFDEEGILWDIRGKKNGYTISPWEKKEDYYLCSVHFHEDGKDYKLKLTVTDRAGNVSVWDKDEAFTIDTIPPQISLSMNRKDRKNDHYYNKDKELQIRILDENPDPEQIVWKIQGQIDGKPLRIRNPQVTKEGETRLVCRLHLTRDGDYSIGLECTDRAGHKALGPQEQFTIDQEKPKLEIRGVWDGCTCTGQAAPSVTIKDLHPDSDRTRIRMVKIGTGDISDQEAYHEQRKSSRHRIRLAWGDFDHIPEADGVYKILVDTEDLAGNKPEEKGDCLFYVNRFGSVYLMDGRTRNKLDSYYLKEEEDVHITEYSVNPVRSKIVLICNNEERRELTDKADYKRVEAFPTGISKDLPESPFSPYAGWRRYDYYIPKDIFSGEGSYQVRIESDGIGRGQEKRETLVSTDNEKKKLPISFVIDKTPPEVILSGLEKAGYKEESHRISFTAMDNQKLDRLRITFYRGWFFREKESLTLREDDLDRMHRWQTELKADHAPQKVCYEAWDQAGNYISSDDKGDSKVCLIQDSGSEGPFQQAVEAAGALTSSGIGWTMWAGIAACLAVCLAVFLICRRKSMR